ncbi:MAG: molybdopterin converting factor subunit 1 [Candidatus Eremiobacteraeota bacterium]|nr:molybdopterin converting factor subunit 1 [Candidatus Eremiobacteraeota bacterium]
MRIHVRLFASQRESIGQSAINADVPDGSTAASALRALTAQYPDLAAASESLAFAVNREHAAPETPLNDGDELALLPPVAGG